MFDVDQWARAHQAEEARRRAHARVLDRIHEGAAALRPGDAFEGRAAPPPANGRGGPAGPPRPVPVLRTLASYRVEPVAWLWQDWLPSGTLTVIDGDPGLGKALALDTLLPTPSGWTTMADVQVGDSLLDEQGRACVVTAVTEVMMG